MRGGSQSRAGNFSLAVKWAKLATPKRYENCILPVARSPLVAPLLLTLLLQACSTVPSSAPQQPAAGPATPPPAGEGAVPELQLNLPQQSQCQCPVPPPEDYTFLEKGYHALLDGEYDTAMEHFQRYQRLETTPRAQLEAGIAIAYVRMLPRSAFYDPAKARSAFQLLREQNAKELKVHNYTRLMRQALLNMLELQDEIDKLKSRNDGLKEDLKKREEALKRLRDLTLNQKAAGQ
jgi:hypothetical protein